MRYQIRYPLESGKRVSVFDLRDTLAADDRKVLTLIPEGWNPGDIGALARIIDSRFHLKHPSLPPILDISFRGRHPGLVTDWIDAPSLEALAGRIDYKNALYIALSLADLLHQLHIRNLQAGYITPRKIFISENRNTIFNFLLPFMRIGPGETGKYSSRFAAPEFVKTGNPTPSADKYSLGMILFMLFTGTCAYTGKSSHHGELPRDRIIIPSAVSSLNPLVSNRISSIISALLHPVPENRPLLTRLIQLIRDELPEFNLPSVEVDSGIVGREKEIEKFTNILNEKSSGLTVIAIKGNPGTGKTRLSEFLRLMASLEGFKILSNNDTRGQNGSSHFGKRNGKLLFYSKMETLKIPPDIPIHSIREASRTIILLESAGDGRLSALSEFTSRLNKTVDTHIFNLQSLTKREAMKLLNNCLGISSKISHFDLIPDFFPASPGYLFRFLNAIRESEELTWRNGSWSLQPNKYLLGEIPATVKAGITTALEDLAPEQISVLNILALYSGRISTALLENLTRRNEYRLNWDIKQLEKLDLIKSIFASSRHEIKISHPWISEILRERLSPKDRQRIHRKIGTVLEQSLLQDNDLPTTCTICFHFLKSSSSEKAGKYLQPALNYLSKNSSFSKALQLFEAAVSEGLISISIPENWLFYIKLLLKTGNETRCREFLKTSRTFTLNSTLLFRLGCILDSLDLKADEICPDIAGPLAEIFSQATCMQALKTSTRINHDFSSASHPIKSSADRTATLGKVRFCHHIYRMYLEQGQPSRAFNHEIKAFRLTLALGKKVAASRRLLNLAHLRLLEDRYERSASWFKYCRQMAEETGDLRTSLEAGIHLTAIDRKNGQNLRAEFELARIARRNDIHCGSKRISSLVLLEETKNLLYRCEHDKADKKISGLHSIPGITDEVFINAEIILLEAQIWAARKFHSRAHSRLDEFVKLTGEKHPSQVVREKLIRSSIYLDQGALSQAKECLDCLIAAKAFLSPCKLAKTRIMQSELYLVQHNQSRAEACVNNALLLSRKHLFIPQIIEAYLQKARCLISGNRNHEARLFAGRALGLALKTDRPELVSKAELVKKMTSQIPGSLYLGQSVAESSESPTGGKESAFMPPPPSITHQANNPGREKSIPSSTGRLRLKDGKAIIGTTPEMKDLLHRLVNVADKDTTVLLQGESGTGKELMARALHEFSDRKEEPFVPVNCSTLPADLVENELFGHVRGSYTGADSTSSGLFESASGGTIFLDEISTLPINLQPRLLRVLADKKIRPLGSTREKNLDVRIVAATNQDLWALVKNDLFREDLYFRLNAVRVEIPPLRNRKQDIPAICLNYIELHPDSSTSRLSPQALEKLGEYNYPGNVRELLNVLENLLCFCPSGNISAGDVSRFIHTKHQSGKHSEIRSSAGDILKKLTSGKINFWSGVRKPFINRDISRREVREIISFGLSECGGSYKELLALFSLEKVEYKKFLSFLEHHDCKVDFREFRPANREK